MDLAARQASSSVVSLTWLSYTITLLGFLAFPVVDDGSGLWSLTFSVVPAFLGTAVALTVYARASLFGLTAKPSPLRHDVRALVVFAFFFTVFAASSGVLSYGGAELARRVAAEPPRVVACAARFSAPSSQRLAAVVLADHHAMPAEPTEPVDVPPVVHWPEPEHRIAVAHARLTKHPRIGSFPRLPRRHMDESEVGGEMEHPRHIRHHRPHFGDRFAHHMCLFFHHHDEMPVVSAPRVDEFAADADAPGMMSGQYGCRVMPRSQLPKNQADGLTTELEASSCSHSRAMSKILSQIPIPSYGLTLEADSEEHVQLCTPGLYEYNPLLLDGQQADPFPVCFDPRYVALMGRTFFVVVSYLVALGNLAVFLGLLTSIAGKFRFFALAALAADEPPMYEALPAADCKA